MIWGKRVLAAVSFLILVPTSIVSCGGAQPGGESAELKRVAVDTQASTVPQGSLVTCGAFVVNISINRASGFLGKREFIVDFKAPQSWGSKKSKPYSLVIREFDHRPDSSFFRLETVESAQSLGNSASREKGVFSITYSDSVGTYTNKRLILSSPHRLQISWNSSNRSSQGGDVLAEMSNCKPNFELAGRLETAVK